MFFKSGVGWGEAGCYRSYTCAYVVDVTSLAFARAPDATLEHGVVWVGMLAFMYACTIDVTLQDPALAHALDATFEHGVAWGGMLTIMHINCDA